jgi:hypothetical protein
MLSKAYYIIMITTLSTCHLIRWHMILIYIILRHCLDNMKAERLLLTMIVAAAILVTPSVLTSPVLAQSTDDEEDGNQGTTGGAQGTDDEEDGNQGTTGGGADDEPPSDMYDEFQSCLETAEGGTGGTGAFATEDEIRDCFIEVGYTGTGDDNDNQDEDENDEEENEDGDEETSTQ